MNRTKLTQMKSIKILIQIKTKQDQTAWGRFPESSVCTVEFRGLFHLVDGLRSVALALKNSLTNLQFEIASFMLINSVQYSCKSPCLSLASFLLFLAKRFLPSEKNTDSLKFNQVTH